MKYGKKHDTEKSVEHDRYFMECEEGEFLSKKIRTKGIENVYIYSTLADVEILVLGEEKATATLYGDISKDMYYFDMFRLSEDTLYIFVTCSAQSIIHTTSKLVVTLPRTTMYNLQVVTSYGTAVVDEESSFRKLKLEIGSGIVPMDRKS